MLQRMSELLKARRDAVEEEVIYRIATGALRAGLDHDARYGKKKFTVDEPVIRDAHRDRSDGDRRHALPPSCFGGVQNEKVVNAITTTPRIGHKLEPFEGEDKIAAQFRAAKLT